MISISGTVLELRRSLIVLNPRGHSQLQSSSFSDDLKCDTVIISLPRRFEETEFVFNSIYFSN
jgi:hypothetical protein